MSERPGKSGGSRRDRLLAALKRKTGAADAAAGVRADVSQAVDPHDGTPREEVEINTVNSVDYFAERCEKDPELDKAIERFGMVVALLKNLLRNREKTNAILAKRLGLDAGDLMQKFIQMVNPLNRAIANPALLSKILQEPRDHFDILVGTIFECEKEEDQRKVDRHIASFMRFMISPMHQKLIAMQEEGMVQKIMDLLQYMHENPDQTLEEAAVMNSFALEPLPEKWRRLCLTADELAAVTTRRRPAATPEPSAAGARHATPAAAVEREPAPAAARPAHAREVLDLDALESDPDLAEALGSLGELFEFFTAPGNSAQKEAIADQIDAAMEARYDRTYPIGGELLAVERRGYHNILEMLVEVFKCRNNTQLKRTVNAVFAVVSDLHLALPARPTARAAETNAQKALRLHAEALACYETDLSRAIELAEEAVELDSTLKNTWFNLGTFYEKSGGDRQTLAAALECYQQVLDLDPEDTEARKANGRVHKKLYPSERLKSPEELFLEALEKPENALVKAALNVAIHAFSGDRAESERAFLEHPEWLETVRQEAGDLSIGWGDIATAVRHAWGITPSAPLKKPESMMKRGWKPENLDGAAAVLLHELRPEVRSHREEETMYGITAHRADISLPDVRARLIKNLGILINRALKELKIKLDPGLWITGIWLDKKLLTPNQLKNFVLLMAYPLVDCACTAENANWIFKQCESLEAAFPGIWETLLRQLVKVGNKLDVSIDDYAAMERNQVFTTLAGKTGQSVDEVKDIFSGIKAYEPPARPEPEPEPEPEPTPTPAPAAAEALAPAPVVTPLTPVIKSPKPPADWSDL